MALFTTKPDHNRLERLVVLEKQIQTGLAAFHVAGLALAEIRDKQLYDHRWKSFEKYAEDRWNLSPPHVSRLIAAANVCENLAGFDPLPANEAQARPLTALEPDQQREAWSATKEALPIGNITAEAVEEAVAKVAPSRKRSRRRKPAIIKIRGKGWALQLTRTTADIDPVAALAEATDKLVAKANEGSAIRKAA